MNNIANLGQEFGHYLINLTSELFFHTGQQHSLGNMERNIRSMLRKVGQFLLSSWLASQETSYLGEIVNCPHCGGHAIYKFKQDATLLTIFGQVGYSRAYFVCPDCNQGHFPLDQKLGLRPGQLSNELENLGSLTGALLPFGQGSQLFEALTLISLDKQCLAEATQAIGQEVQTLERRWLAQSQNLDWLHKQCLFAERPKQLYGLLDEGVSPIFGKKDKLKIGAWFTTMAEPLQSPDDAGDISITDLSFYCDTVEVQQFGQLLWATGCQHHAELAQTLIFLGDGKDWTWALIEEYYPRAIQIVDWHYGTGQIDSVANAAFDDEGKKQRWIRQVKADLWAGNIEAVIAAFNHFTQQPHAREAANRARDYVSRNRQRMNYPEYRANGFQISSGTVRNGCNQILAQWLSLADANWNQTYAISSAKVRAALLSGYWQTIISRREEVSLSPAD